jgi:hypothetical protein
MSVYVLLHKETEARVDVDQREDLVLLYSTDHSRDESYGTLPFYPEVINT